MTLEISTPALLFPAISLLFLSYTNRFLHLSALIRQLHHDWLEKGDRTARRQIDNQKSRLKLIRAMQFFGAVSLFLCVLSMLGVIAGWSLLEFAGIGVFWNRIASDGAVIGLPDKGGFHFWRGAQHHARSDGGKREDGLKFPVNDGKGCL